MRVEDRASQARAVVIGIRVQILNTFASITTGRIDVGAPVQLRRSG